MIYTYEHNQTKFTGNISDIKKKKNIPYLNLHLSVCWSYATRKERKKKKDRILNAYSRVLNMRKKRKKERKRKKRKERKKKERMIAKMNLHLFESNSYEIYKKKKKKKRSLKRICDFRVHFIHFVLIYFTRKCIYMHHSQQSGNYTYFLTMVRSLVPC